MKSFFAILVSLVGLQAAEVRLAWDANDEPNVIYYTVVAGTNSGQYYMLFTVQGRTNTTLTISNLSSATHYFAVRAVNDQGLASQLSNEVSDGPLPKLRIISYVQSMGPGDSWRNETNFNSQITMKSGVGYRSEVYSELVTEMTATDLISELASKTNLLKLTTYVQELKPNGSWINVTNFINNTPMRYTNSYRTLVFTEVLP